MPPSCKPLTTAGDATLEVGVPTGAPFCSELTAYPVIGVPPLLAGAVQLTVACRTPAAALTPVGAPGTSGSVIPAEAPDGALLPTPLVATTVKV